MTDLVIRGGALLSGSIRAPPSKSYTHRAIISASLSNGLSEVRNALLCDDTLATIEACRKIGAEINESDNETLRILGSPKPKTPEDVINCRDSGSTIRFMTPICALADGISVLTGGRSLRNRPMGPLLEALGQLGIKCYSTRGDGRPPIVVFGGGIRGGRAVIRGDVSSQFITGLLFASPMAENDTSIVLSTPLESKSYIDLTLSVLGKHGILVEVGQGSFHIPSGQEYKPYNHFIEGDYSSAAFLLAAAAITGSRIRVENLFRDSLQGDRLITKILGEVGAEVRVYDNFIEVEGSGEPLNPINIDMRDNPDLVPVCAVLACVARGESVISGVRRLRFKESDRVEALLAEFSKMNADIKALDDSLVIRGVRKLRGADIDPHGDHRIAMACAVLALVAEGETVIHDAECINKSYPDFIRDMRLLGVKALER
ncbi:MAG: 3-phosphoshikimate 1-carboxyvinyltransferase [Candidatus Bathyarchaeota archaeon]|nr:3-phosphoshikimate 1-carboxyvinyltransferase [Candidatus Bathyarchaeota archaeon]